jgi:hypothetical protein
MLLSTLPAFMLIRIEVHCEAACSTRAWYPRSASAVRCPDHINPITTAATTAAMARIAEPTPNRLRPPAATASGTTSPVSSSAWSASGMQGRLPGVTRA